MAFAGSGNAVAGDLEAITFKLASWTDLMKVVELEGDKVANENLTLKKEVSRLTNHLSRIDAQKAVLNQKIEEANTMRSQAKDLVNSASVAEMAGLARRAQLATLVSKLDCSGSGGKGGKAGAPAPAAPRESLKAEIEELRQALLDDRAKDIERIATVNEMLRAEVDQLTQRLDEYENERDVITKNEKAALEAQVHRLSHKLKTARDESAAKDRQLLDMKKLEAEYARQKELFDRLQTQVLADQAPNTASKEASASPVKETVKITEPEVIRIEVEPPALREELNNVKSELEQVRDLLSHIKRELGMTRTDCAEKIEENSKLQSAVEDLQEEKAALQMQVARTGQQLDALLRALGGKGKKALAEEDRRHRANTETPHSKDVIEKESGAVQEESTGSKDVADTKSRDHRAHTDQPVTREHRANTEPNVTRGVTEHKAAHVRTEPAGGKGGLEQESRPAHAEATGSKGDIEQESRPKAESSGDAVHETRTDDSQIGSNDDSHKAQLVRALSKVSRSRSIGSNSAAPSNLTNEEKEEVIVELASKLEEQEEMADKVQQMNATLSSKAERLEAELEAERKRREMEEAERKRSEMEVQALSSALEDEDGWGDSF